MRGDADMRSRGLVPVPDNFLSVLHDAMRNPEKFALETFHAINSLKPLSVPPPLAFQDPKALRAWQEHGTPIPDALVNAFSAWLSQTMVRTGIIEENKRRLRATTWAQRKFVELDKHDFARQLADFHRDEWGIVRVCEDSGECEEQLQAVARNGQRRVRHG